MRENTEQKKVRIWTFLKQRQPLLFASFLDFRKISNSLKNVLNTFSNKKDKFTPLKTRLM